MVSSSISAKGNPALMPLDRLNRSSLPAGACDMLGEVIGNTSITPCPHLIQFLEHLPLSNDVLQREDVHLRDQVNYISSIVDTTGSFEMLWKHAAQSDLCLLDLPLRGSWAKHVPGMGSMVLSQVSICRQRASTVSILLLLFTSGNLSLEPQCARVTLRDLSATLVGRRCVSLFCLTSLCDG